MSLIVIQSKSNMLKIGKKKTNKLETIIRMRFGNFELRVAQAKIEIEDVVTKTTKHVYSNLTYEYGLITFLLSKQKRHEDKMVNKSAEEIEVGIKNVEFLIYMLAHTNLIFSNEQFRADYYKLVTDLIVKSKPVEVDKKEDAETIEQLKTVDEMKEAV